MVKRSNNAMVKSELEAAQALAELAKAESLQQQADSVLVHTASLRLSSDSPEDEAVAGQRRCKNIYTVTTNKAKDDRAAELHKPSTTNARSHMYVTGSKSRQKMTEEEKEARRIRRVLANRESARQTIRRRQALYEELIRKAASLAQDNETLKSEMDAAVQEYNSLKTTNESLKVQMVKATKLDEPQADSTPSNAEMSKSSCTSCPYIVYNQSPPFPLIWPAFGPPPNAYQTANMTTLYPEQANPENKNVPTPPLYILPCPIFYPVPDHGSPFDSKSDQIVSPISYSYTVNTSTTTMGQCFEEARAEASSSRTTHEVPFRFKPNPSVLVKPIASVKPVTSDFISNTITLDTEKEKKLDLNVCPSKKQTDTVAAAEARKRRKELTKLRSLHTREFGRG